MKNKQPYFPGVDTKPKEINKCYRDSIILMVGGTLINLVTILIYLKNKDMNVFGQSVWGDICIVSGCLYRKFLLKHFYDDEDKTNRIGKRKKQRYGINRVS